MFDAFRNSPAQNRRGKVERYTRHVKMHDQVAEWIVRNIKDGRPEHYPVIVDAVDDGNKLMMRLQNRLESGYSDELMDDTLLTIRSLPTLKYLVAHEHGFSFGVEATRAYPDLYYLTAEMDEDMLRLALAEAMNTISSIYRKYPY